MSSLTRTLEDLEARLGRLSHVHPDTVEARGGSDVPETLSAVPETPGAPAAERLRKMIEQRIAASRSGLEASSGIAIDAAAPPQAPGAKKPRRRKASSPALDRRFGTIAGEVEQLQLQGQTLQLISGVAEELQVLKAEIRQTMSGRDEAGFEALRTSFEELRALVGSQGQGGPQAGEIASILDRLSAMQAESVDRDALDQLRGEIDRVSHLVGEMARQDTVAAVNKRWDEFEARLSKHVELDGAAKRDLNAELERLRLSVGALASEEQIRAVESRWVEFESRYLDTVRGETQEHFTRLLKDELDTLRERIDALGAVGGPDGARMDALSGRMDEALGRLSGRLEQIEEALVALPDIFGIERLEGRIRALGEGIEALAARVDDADLEHFVILEERLDEISEALVASATRGEAAFDMAPIERIEARVADLAARLEKQAAQDAPEGLAERVAELSARIEAMSAEPRMDAVEAHMRAFSARIETAIAQIEQPTGTNEAFEARLSALSDRLEEAAAARVDDEVVRSLEAQIGRLAEQLSQSLPLSGASEADPALGQRLAAIEERLEAGRADVMTAARAAADEAVRQMREDGARREGEHVLSLSEDLRSLEALCRQTDDRSIQVFEAVHATLLKIVERLTTIEKEMAGGGAAPQPAPAAAPVVAAPTRVSEPEPVLDTASVALDAPFVRASAPADEAPGEARGLRAAIARHFGGRGTASAAPNPADRLRADKAQAGDAEAPARAELADTPSIDAADSIFSREANRPLEPGSGAPDIASLLERVRQQQSGKGDAEPVAKADFIAAARKAALAAAAEAETLSSAPGEEGPAPKGTGRHRKPILMAVGAVLLALMAMPLGRSFLEERVAQAPADDIVVSAVPSLPQPAEPATSEPASASETQSSVVSATQPEPVPQAEPAAPPVAEAPAVLPASAPEEGASGSATPAVELAEERLDPAAQTQPANAEAATAEAPGAPDASLLLAALEKLPGSARGDLPAAPSAIGTTPLVAAAEGGDPRAIFEIGLRLLEGRTGTPRPAEALDWFAHSAALGFAPAQYSLGTLFEKGNGVDRNATAARDWYTLAAEAGNVRAMHNLAVLYATGIDGRSEPETAARWFVEAAERGMRDSQYNLGILHARGAGVAQDLGQSYKWFQIVGRAGDADALAKAQEVAKALNGEELAALDEEIAAWTPTERVEAANAVDIPSEWAGEPQTTASVDMTRAIRNVQAILAKLGYDAGVPDGIVGERTTQAVRAFQKDNGMPESGEIDEALIRELLERNV
ncbi:peptidoglycan-binding protein [Aureimonas populi]|uniref:Peptidoglycan-binding protein n=1 Tax=Aureimonas populi TaxID=1701758 RepID=A0ABW5CFY2_9HYPH|nr:peptidoglycan-binding protein [Aureimonas populi]